MAKLRLSQKAKSEKLRKKQETKGDFKRSASVKTKRGHTKSIEISKTINVKNAMGEADTKAEIIIQNSINYTPKVSVVMPVYNVEAYLPRCLDSVLNQTMKEIELICVDDGSTDASLDILKKYAINDRRITIITQKNHYAGVARNAGLSQAKGEYLCFLDSDDFFEPTLFEETYNLAETEQSQIVFYQYKSYDNESQQCYGEPRGINARLTDKEYITLSTKAVKDKLFTLCNPMPWNKLINHKLAVEEDLHFQSLPASNDVCFSLNVLSCAKQITLYYKSLVYYRYNRRGSLKNTRDKNPLNFYEAYKGIYNTLQEKGLYDRYKKTFLTSLVSTSLWTLKNTDEKHEFVKQFIRDEIVPKYVSPNLNMLDSTILDKLKRVYHPDIIVSLTSYPARIGTIHLVIESILNQSFKADKVILWLAPEQFPNKEADLPKELLDLQEQGLTIDWYHDIRSYKKLIPTLKKYPEAIIVTADDDNIYQKDWLKKLFNNYVKYPTDIQAHRVTKFHYANNRFYTVSGGREYYKGANYLNKLVGVGGVLYPPHCFYKDILNEDLIQQLAPTNDDQWFWLQAALNGVKVRVVDDPDIKAHNVEGTQETGLTNINDHGENLFWKDFNNILTHYTEVDEILQEEDKRNMKKYRNDSPYKEELMHWYERTQRRVLNLDNPKTFNEKIQWMKLYAATPIKTRLADKYLVRDWVEERVGKKYLIPLLGVYDKVEDINFKKLPKQFVMKCNHGSGYNIIVNDKSQMDLEDIKSKLNRWMNENFAFRVGVELQYMHMQPKIVIEKMLKNKKSEDLNDYKFYCFDGEVKYVQVISERINGTHKVSFYDMDWKKQSWWDNDFYEGYVEKPEKFDEMVEVAQKLCKGFNFVRVDLYYLDTNEIYFGEMTFSPSSGGMRWSSEAVNLKLGSMIKLPAKAYDVDTGKYYKLRKNSLLKSYIKLPYNIIKLMILHKIKNNKINEDILNQLSGIRIDIKNFGQAGNSFELKTNKDMSVSEPKWFTDEQGIGRILQSSQMNNTLKLKAINSGKLLLTFRGQDKRFKDKRLPVWVDCESIKINDKDILSEPVAVWHDKSFKYEMPVKDGQEITLEIKQKYHQYTPKELKDIVLKLNGDSDYIRNNIESIMEKLRKRLSIMDEKTYKNKRLRKDVADIFSNLTEYRIDIQNRGNRSNTLEVEVKDIVVSEPKWLNNAAGIGKTLQACKKHNIVKIKAINDGLLKFRFRGPDKRYDGRHLPVWIDYKSVKIDGKEILEAPVATCHDRPYIYEMPVKDGQEITLEFEQQYHEYAKDELKHIILKLNKDNAFVKENVESIADKILENLGSETLSVQTDIFPQITADCFIPIGEACRVANWLRVHKLRYCSLPFDWLGECSLKFILKSIRYGISDWFNEYIVDSSKSSKRCHYVYDTKNQFRSRHAFPLEKSVDEYMPEFKEIFGKRYSRMIELIKDSTNICFVCNNRSDTVYDFYLFIKEVQKMYPNKTYKLLHVHHNYREQSVTEIKFGHNITVYDIEAYDIHKKGSDKSNPSFWIGNENLWNNVCKNLSLSDETKEKLPKDDNEVNQSEELIKTDERSDKINELIDSINDKRQKEILTSEEEVAASEEIFDLKNIEIMNTKDTIKKIISERLSVSRFGDGEVRAMLSAQSAFGFQRADKRLSNRLRDVFLSDNSNTLICLSRNYVNGAQVSDFWSEMIKKTKYDLAMFSDCDRTFGNTDITRNAKNIPMMKKIWQDKDVVLVEGKLSRLGVGNDLFDNVKSLQRILCPERNAFDKYNEILKECRNQPKNKLFLIALGPTATVLAYDLADLGYWAIDVGHIDIIYEWSLRGGEKIAIPGKYVNEAKNGAKDIADCTDPSYLNSIIAKVA